jgi:hypothetical protein
MSDRAVNFLYLGPGRSGSTWLHEVLVRHPEVFLSGAKDLYFFSRCYSRGLGWYQAQFHAARPGHKIIGEVGTDYLACAQAPARIRACLGPDVRLMATLRDPVLRAFSAYLYLNKHGLAAPSFRQTALASPELIEEGRYGTQLCRYLEHFSRRALYVTLFDDLQQGPQHFLNGVTDWLGITRQTIGPGLTGARLPSSEARWLPLASLARRGADWVREHDGAELVGRVKRSALVQRALYKPLRSDRPVMSPEDVSFVRERLEPEVARVEEEFGIPLRQRWGW